MRSRSWQGVQGTALTFHPAALLTGGFFPLESKFLWRQKRNPVSQKGSRETHLSTSLAFRCDCSEPSEPWPLTCPFLAGGLSLRRDTPAVLALCTTVLLLACSQERL